MVFATARIEQTYSRCSETQVFCLSESSVWFFATARMLIRVTPDAGHAILQHARKHSLLEHPTTHESLIGNCQLHKTNQLLPMSYALRCVYGCLTNFCLRAVGMARSRCQVQVVAPEQTANAIYFVAYPRARASGLWPAT